LKQIVYQMLKVLFCRYGVLVFSIFMSLGLFAQDWGGLEHFREQNEALSPPQSDENRVVFMGNSITIGWSHSRPDFFQNKHYINRGISGQTTSQMLLRFRNDVISLAPKVVVILAGTNDIAGNTGPISLEEILDNIKSMSELADFHGIQVLLCSVLPASDYRWSPGKNPHIKIPKLNQMMKQYAEKNGYGYLDYFSALTDGNSGMKKEYADDGVHPTAEGYKIMEKLLTQKLSSL